MVKKDEVQEDTSDVSTALAKSEHTLANLTFADVKAMAGVFYTSKMFKDVGDEAQAIVKIMAGHELGLGAVYSMQRLYMVDGKLGMAAETMGALVKNSKRYDYRVKEHTNEKCSISFYDNGKEVYVSTFTMQDAKKANLVKFGGAWNKYPRAMLFSRALSQGARIVAPDAISGAYTLEELQSISDKPASVVIEDPPEVAEGVNTNAEDVVEGEVTEESSLEGNPYAPLLEKCTEHDEPWFVNQYGKHFHKVGNSFCNFGTSQPVKDTLKAVALVIGFYDERGNDLNAYCKSKFGAGQTWSKISDEDKLDVIWDFAKMADNPVLLEAAKIAIGKKEEGAE